MTTHQTRTSIIKSEAHSEGAMVATKDRHATEAGLDILSAGGNAIDAAVAACFAIGVVEPASSGIGGGGYLVFEVGGSGGVVGFPMRGPLNASSEMYKLSGEPVGGGFGWAEVLGDENLEGPKSICTPGAVAGLFAAHRLHGRLPMPELMAPAINLARAGFTPGWHNSYALNSAASRFYKFPELKRIFMPDGSLPSGFGSEPGSLKQPDLADTLEAISREGPGIFYKGEIAHAMVNAVQQGGGVLSLEDLSRYQPFVWDGGLEFNYRGHNVRVPPYACAGTTSAMTLKLMNRFDLKALGNNSVEMLHAYISAARLAYTDRFQYMADPEMCDAPWQGLVSDEYIAQRVADIPREITGKFLPGDPWKYEDHQPEIRKEASLPGWDYGTTHLCVIDREGNAVSLTNTLGGSFGSGFVAEGTGVALNNGMMWFDTLPNRINSIEPGKLPLNNMSPALVFDSSGVRIAVGASGGRRITNCVTQLAIKIIDFGMGPQEAINSPRVDCSMPYTSIDPRLDKSVVSELNRRGHNIEPIGDGGLNIGFPSFASPVAIVRDGDKDLRAGVDVFQSAYAAGI